MESGTETVTDSDRLPSPEAPAAAAVYFKDKWGNLHQLKAPEATEIVKAAARGQRYVDLNKCEIGGWWVRSSTSGQDQGRKVPPIASCACDLERMKHMNSKTGEEEDIIIEVPWNSSVMKAIVGRDTDGSMRRQVLKMALERIRRCPVLDKILATKGLVARQVRENPYIKSGHAPFDNFLASLLVYRPSYLHRLLIETASWDDGSPMDESYQAMERAGVGVVFHGTNHAVMDAILEQGLIPGGASYLHYFGAKYQISRGYTRDKTPGLKYNYVESCKVLVFLILRREGPIPAYGAVTVCSTQDELPIAEVTVPAAN